jgi:hypothetical protein
MWELLKTMREAETRAMRDTLRTLENIEDHLIAARRMLETQMFELDRMHEILEEKKNHEE